MKIFRLLEISMVNIQSVEKGSVVFPDDSANKKDPHALADIRGSIVGLYGQNGSGKTTVCVAVSAVCAYATKGFLSLPPNGAPNSSVHLFPHLLRKGSQEGSISLRCALLEGEERYVLDYRLGLANKEGFGPTATYESVQVDKLDPLTGTFKSYLPELRANYLGDAMEELLYDGLAHRGNKKGNFAANKSFSSLGPLLGRKYANAQISMSFLFSPAYISFLRQSNNPKCFQMADILSALLAQLSRNLFFYGPRNDALQAMGIGIPVGGAKQRGDAGILDASGALPIGVPISKKQAQAAHSLVEQINILVGAAVPGFKLKLLEQTVGKAQDGEPIVLLQWVRLLGDKGEIPLYCESSGIQKLAMLSSAFVLAAGNPSVWFFIDEFDSGVFEQLLSQLVQSFLEVGKGQILFTAHNLKGLETLPSNHVVFATANPKERFIRFRGLKRTNNLRDQYLRALALGGQSEPLSKATSVHQIERALYQASRAYEAGPKEEND